MKILFEGTEEQVRNLSALIGKSDEDLPVVKDHCQTESLWSIYDVQARFDCTNEQALKVVAETLVNAATMEQIWSAIDVHAEAHGLKRIEKRYE